jgi:hypothetical protein
VRQPTSQEARDCSAGPCDSCSHYHNNGGACNPGAEYHDDDESLGEWEHRTEAMIADSENQAIAEE